MKRRYYVVLVIIAGCMGIALWAAEAQTQTANTSLGNGALASNTTGDGNTAMGNQALQANTTGKDNTATGAGSLMRNTFGTGNTAMGASALNANTTGPGNTAMGASALHSNATGFSNTAVGREALWANIEGIENSATGDSALHSNTTGRMNVAVGARALYDNKTGSENAAIGINALERNGTGRGNTAVGYLALSSLQDAKSGTENTAVGWGAGRALKTGSRNVYVANLGEQTEDRTIRIGEKGTQIRAFIAGISGVPVTGGQVVVDSNGQLGLLPSSLRYKEDVRPMGDLNQNLQKLRPVTFRYKFEVAGDHSVLEYGLVAEEVAEVFPDLVGRDARGENVTVHYHKLIPILLNELQKQHRQIELLRTEVSELKVKRDKP